MKDTYDISVQEAVTCIYMSHAHMPLQGSPFTYIIYICTVCMHSIFSSIFSEDVEWLNFLMESGTCTCALGTYMYMSAHFSLEK